MSCPVVKAESVTLPLSKGDYLVVKKRLNAGEQQEMFAQLAKTMVFGEKVEVQASKVAFVKPAIYLLDWSYTDLKGNPIDIVDKPLDFIIAALRSFGAETLREISGAIDAHENEQDAEVALRKNSPDGETSPSAISPSVA